MPEGLLPVFLIIAFVVLYVVAKVIGYMRKSEQQWEQVDKSKLREWEDDDDWDA
jgi:large-conductance mechanosensitive channel